MVYGMTFVMLDQDGTNTRLEEFPRLRSVIGTQRVHRVARDREYDDRKKKYRAIHRRGSNELV